jgi:hypothetical protein
MTALKTRLFRQNAARGDGGQRGGLCGTRKMDQISPVERVRAIG